MSPSCCLLYCPWTRSNKHGNFCENPTTFLITLGFFKILSRPKQISTHISFSKCYLCHWLSKFPRHEKGTIRKGTCCTKKGKHKFSLQKYCPAQSNKAHGNSTQGSCAPQQNKSTLSTFNSRLFCITVEEHLSKFWPTIQESC